MLHRNVLVYFATRFKNPKTTHDLEKTQAWMEMIEETLRRENEGTRPHVVRVNENFEPEINEEGLNGTEVQINQEPIFGYNLSEEEFHKNDQDGEFQMFLSNEEWSASQKSAAKEPEKKKKKKKVGISRKEFLELQDKVDHIIIVVTNLERL